MKATFLFIALFLMAFSLTVYAVSPVIDSSFYIQNGFDSNGKLLPAFQSNVDKWNQIIDSKVPSWVPNILPLSFKLSVNDHGTNHLYRITVKDWQVSSIREISNENATTMISTYSDSIDRVLNSDSQIKALKKEIRQGHISIETQSNRIKVMLWLFLL